MRLANKSMQAIARGQAKMKEYIQRPTYPSVIPVLIQVMKAVMMKAMMHDMKSAKSCGVNRGAIFISGDLSE